MFSTLLPLPRQIIRAKPHPALAIPRMSALVGGATISVTPRIWALMHGVLDIVDAFRVRSLRNLV
jgi:hypothetical protein